MSIKNKLKNFKYSFNRKFVLEDYHGLLNYNFGCGNSPIKKFVNVDYFNHSFADEVLDLENLLPFDSDTIDLIYSDNVFEHIRNYLQLMCESFRVLRPGGHLIIKVPYFKSKHAFVDPTHINYFTIQSLDYFVSGTYFNEKYPFYSFSFNKLDVFLDNERKSFLRRLISVYAIKRPNKFENSILSNLFVFHNIIYVLKK